MASPWVPIIIVIGLVVLGYLFFGLHMGSSYQLPQNVIGLVSNTLTGAPANTPAGAATTQSTSTTQTTTQTTTTVPPVQITGNNQVENVTVTDQSSVNLVGNYDNIGITFETRSEVTVNFTGNYDNLTLINGKVNMDINGNYNRIHYINTTVYSKSVVGNDNQ